MDEEIRIVIDGKEVVLGPVVGGSRDHFKLTFEPPADVEQRLRELLAAKEERDEQEATWQRD